MRNTADDAIAKRRAELRRLQQQRGKSAGITERLSQAAAASSSNNRGAPMMRSVVVNNHNTSRFGAKASKMAGGKTQQVTARRLDESYKANNSSNNNGVATNNNSAAASGPPAPQKMTNNNNSAASSIPIMAAKRTSEIFPPKRSSTSSSMSSSAVNRQQNQTNIAPPATMPSNNNNNMTMGSANSHHYQQQPPPSQKQQSATKPPPKQQFSQYQQPPPAVTNSPIIHNYNHHQSPSLNSIQSTSSYGSSNNNNNITKSPFGQARVTKVIPALSLNGNGGGLGGVKSLVPPLSMLDPPPLLDEAIKVGGGSSGGGVAATSAAAAPSVVKVPLKTVDVAKKLSSVKGGVANDSDKMTTPRERKEDEKEGEVINSGQSTPIIANLMEESPPKSVAAAGDGGDDGGSTGVGGDGNKSKAAVLPNVSATLQEAKMALLQEKVDDADITATNNETDSSPKENEKEQEEVNHQPQSKKEEEKHIPEKDESRNTSNGKNTNLSRLKLDLERSEKEKLEALEQVAKLKSLLEAGGVGSSNGGEAPRLLDQLRSTIDSPRRTVTTPRSGGGGFGIGGITTPRGGNTPNRFTPNRSQLPPLAWGTPRSGNSRAGSRTGSPEHHGHYGSMNGTPRVRASPLPKQLNRVVSDTQLNKTAGDDDGTTPQEERVEEQFLVAAARSIPNEYGTPLASYFVRRPHVTDDSLEKNETDELAKLAIDLWGNKCTHLSSSDDYKKYASVFKPESLEIVACIEADGSVFTLSGECNARHGKVSTMSSNNGSFDEDDSNIVDKEYDWSVFDNVEEMDRALGRVSYIDEEGNEREYWLDSIYEEALTTRESYCTSMISAAFTLKEVRGPLAQKREQPASWNQTMQSQPTPMQSFQSFAPPKSTVEGSVNMSHPPMNQQNVPQSNANAPQTQSQRSEPVSKVEMPSNPARKEPLSAAAATKASSSKEETKQKQSPPPEEYEPSDSALTVMVVALFSIFFKLSWLFIKTPFRVASMILTFWIMMIALRVLCLFLADDNGAWDIGAGVEYEYNMPGIY